jgi:putative flippase GtrA
MVDAHRTAPRIGALATFTRSALAGGAATVVDLGVIAFAVGALHLSPRAANLPALLAGAVVQFVGNRHFAFRARSGPLGRQLALFALTEAGALALNGLAYHLVASVFVLGVSGAVLARAVTTNAVYVLYSYPLWRRVFRSAPLAAPRGATR